MTYGYNPLGGDQPLAELETDALIVASLEGYPENDQVGISNSVLGDTFFNATAVDFNSSFIVNTTFSQTVADLGMVPITLAAPTIPVAVASLLAYFPDAVNGSVALPNSTNDSSNLTIAQAFVLDTAPLAFSASVLESFVVPGNAPAPGPGPLFAPFISPPGEARAA